MPVETLNLYLFHHDDEASAKEVDQFVSQGFIRKEPLMTGCSLFLSALTRNGEPDSFLPKLKYHAKALSTKLPELCSLLAEILTETVFTNRKRVRELIEQAIVDIELNLQRSAHQLTASRIAAYLGAAGSYNDAATLPFHRFLKELAAHLEERYGEMVEAFEEILPRLINRNGLLVGVTSNESLYEAMAAELPALLDRFSTQDYAAETYAWDCVSRNEGLMSSSRVQYVAKGANYQKLGHPYTGCFHVLETILRYDYFWNRIRVQGGAYGAFTSFQRSGFMFFGSYRDPNLEQTLAVFDGTADYLRNLEIPDREMDKYVIGTMSNVDMPLTPQMKGNAAQDCYIRGVTYDDRQKSRDEILATGQQDIRAMAETVTDCMKANHLCVFGNEELLKEKTELFGRILSVND